MFMAEVLIIAKRWKQPKCTSVDEGMNKMCHIHTMEYYSAIKRKEVLIHATIWMNFENIILSEKSQLQKSIYYMIAFI